VAQFSLSQGILGSLGPCERLALGFLSALSAVALVRCQKPLAFLGSSTILGLAILGLAWWAPRSRFGTIVRNFSAVPIVVILFILVGPVVADSNPWRADGFLASLDARYFGSLAENWRGLLGRPDWLTDAASLAYLSYYWLPVLMLVGLYVQKRRPEMEDFAFQMMLVCFAFFVAYFFAPAAGPRVAPELEDALLGGGRISQLMRGFLRAAEPSQLDAFPSGHTGVSMAFMVVGWRLFPRWRIPLLLIVAGIIFSTVYLSLHYVVDLAAGAVLGPLALAAAPRVHRLCEPFPRDRRSGRPIEPEALF
jgi:membrane-associated phospholipid phosphatase